MKNYVPFNLEGVLMFSISYPSSREVQAYATQAHRLRSRAMSGLIRDLARWVSAAAR
jgi:hypothetical protein